MAGGDEAEAITMHVSPTRAAYAAAEAPWFPLDATTTPGAPVKAAALTVQRFRRSLWLQVGFWLSSFTKSSQSSPTSAARSEASINGVFPAPMSIFGANGGS